MNKKNNGFFSIFLLMMKNGPWVIMLIMAVQSFVFKLPEYVTLGIMFIVMGLLLCPGTNYLLKKIKVFLSKYQKCFIGLLCFVTSSLLIKPGHDNYVNCVLYLVIVIIIIGLTIIYSKYKTKKK